MGHREKVEEKISFPERSEKVVEKITFSERPTPSPSREEVEWALDQCCDNEDTALVRAQLARVPWRRHRGESVGPFSREAPTAQESDLNAVDAALDSLSFFGGPPAEKV